MNSVCVTESKITKCVPIIPEIVIRSNMIEKDKLVFLSVGKLNERGCYGLHVCVPSKFICLNHNPLWDCICRWGLWEVIRPLRWSPHNRISALVRKYMRDLASFLFSLQCEGMEKHSHLQTRRKALTRT